jgi:hypothetical protein
MQLSAYYNTDEELRPTLAADGRAERMCASVTVRPVDPSFPTSLTNYIQQVMELYHCGLLDDFP